MKKKLTAIVTCTLLTPSLLSSNPSFIYAENQVKQVHSNEHKQVDRRGLIGYYFKENDFKSLALFAPTLNDFMYDQNSANDLLNKESQQYQSIRWIGLIKSKETGDFRFELSDDTNAIIEINGQIVSNKGNNKQEIHLEKDQLVPIKIEYQANKILKIEDIKNLNLIKKNHQNESYQIGLNELRKPDFNKKETNEFLKKAGGINLFKAGSLKDSDDSTDTDGDAIPDSWEENGYTIHKNVAVPWDNSFANKGYKKFVSNPYKSHTVSDPYSDYEKAAGDIPAGNAPETKNPLVAAFPSVNVGLEKVVLSKNKDMSHSVGSNSSENWSYTNTEGVNVDTGWDGLGPKIGISANYQHSETVAKEWGYSTDDTSHINGAESAYLNANVRYQNVGTGAIYNVKPTTNFVLDDTTIGTIKAKENTTALSLPSGESYPKRGQHGIAINTMDDFNSRPIPLNKEQLQTYMSNRKPILLETTQTEGKYATINTEGQVVISGDWNGIAQEVENKTASILVDTGENVSEKRVAGKDYNNPEDLTPELTLKEALKLAYPNEIAEKGGLLFYNDKPIYEEAILSYVDQYTAKRIKEQIKDNSGRFKDVTKLYDVKLEPKMNFTLKLATLYDGAESGSSSINEDTISSPLGEWFGPKNSVTNLVGGNTGKRQYRLSKYENTYVGWLVLSPEIQNKLKKNYKYYISMFIKADKDIEPTIRINHGFNAIVNKKVKLSSDKYQRIDILVDNSESNLLDGILCTLGVSEEDKEIGTNYNGNIYIDDVAITEVSAIKQ
ncbi:binary toxin-like calcium binding domain-containing protein [Bacillus thuringiensis]|uniref:binary toxin-like calcium binding domain-containing protein n=1 Tax=Bacillus cereus group TaxID=86661 RepID=UPI0005AEE751|nr:binary toxin-like calcium binding domain-containing protein [Bacillus thuringiensis]MCU5281585.1 PA14 domain-containing protein [Bacillus cereus]AMR88629.1 hypothetical protein A3L20_32230 [Bacillus thuringiensis]KIP24954.1 clostridial binary toxin B/anthrax toxin PA family protein [Bacillus thuringiensis serovar morrisoni]MBG9640162.1 hypothetical protein [Bacillus thuringiensis]MBG9675845.1 hypothetical protein [Bacillus thuringiensis]